MTMKNFARGALGAAALLLGLAQARADYSVNPATATNPLTVCGFSVSNVVLPCHVMVNSSKQEIFTLTKPGMVGLTFGGAALSLGQASAAQSLPVVLPNNPDILNTAATITAADAASTSAAGQNGVAVVSGTPTVGSVYSVAVNGQSEADFVITGSFAGTLAFEGSANGGLTWTPRSAHVMGTKYRQTQVTGPGVFHINAAGLNVIRVRAIALTSGTPSIQLNTTAGTGSIYVMNDIELVDQGTGLSPSVKAGGAAALTDPALTVQNPAEAAALAALNTAFGACTEAAWTGTGTPTFCSVLKALFGQAAPTSIPGTSIASSVPVPGFQGVANGVPVGVSLASLPAFASTPAFNLTQIAGAALSAANPLPAQLSVAGAAATMANPVPVANSINGAAVSSSNPLPVDTVVRTTAASRSTILPVQENTAAVAAGGTGNVVGDVLTFAGGSSTVPVSTTQATPGKCTVTAVTSGAVTACAPLAGSLGSYTALPANPVATTSSGSGTGTTLNLTYTGLSVQIAAANAARRALHVQPQGGLAYMSGLSAATADQNAMKLPADGLYTTDPHVVGTGAVNVITGGSLPLPLYAREF